MCLVWNKKSKAFLGAEDKHGGFLHLLNYEIIGITWLQPE
jgi:hypothetical protein